MNKYNWICPFCNHATIVHDGAAGTISSFRHEFSHGNQYGDQALRGLVIVCPNDKCKQYTVSITLHDHVTQGHTHQDMSHKRRWQLIPDSTAKVFPSYIPKAILDDYNEACKISDLSPKASATLSRRCLQGMIRDFWGIKKGRLIDEIDSIRDKVDAETWEAIDAVRQIGNIGAHMEKDINLIIDVEPNEARLLIGLIESLLTDWYVARYQRRERMNSLKLIAESKKDLRNSN